METQNHMQIGGEDYYRTALERLADAQLLFQDARGSYSLSMYCAGLAVECMCRAFIWTARGEFDGRHDLPKLFKESGLLQRREKVLRNSGKDEHAVEMVSRALRAAANDVTRLWSNVYRFAAESKVRAELNSRNAYIGVKGDVLKANCRKLIDAAFVIVEAGETLWTSAKR